MAVGEGGGALPTPGCVARRRACRRCVWSARVCARARRLDRVRACVVPALFSACWSQRLFACVSRARCALPADMG
eukprot:4248295-Pleurochrysis_carterae.AAC.1